ncbi:hypothetical protein AV530_005886 [Patagioenas fasciata monilis]|uniref:Secreted protein n=1 Tax=Patagioenas fasciata monilis TaxID=372326 RepID=A0A1V4JN20_PATFA|nr:hypothetical protein AV530_005886 [Patagioenas fasciata monilis]
MRNSLWRSRFWLVGGLLLTRRETLPAGFVNQKLTRPRDHQQPSVPTKRKQEASRAVHNLIRLLGGGAHGKHRAGVRPLNPAPHHKTSSMFLEAQLEQNCC